MQNPAQTSSPIFLDHVGFIVEDLPASRALFAGLGFTLTERADHTRTNAQGEKVSAGSSQHSIMLGTGYIELMQITDRQAGHQRVLVGVRRALTPSRLVCHVRDRSPVCDRVIRRRSRAATTRATQRRPCGNCGRHGRACPRA